MPPQIKQDLNRSGWETTDFPSVCENCLPENPYVKMLKEDYGAECKLCTRPFTVFSWSGDGRAHGRKRRTNICLTCARLKNACQCCIMDLQFGLPIVIRDKALELIAPGPQSEINREYFAQNNEKAIEEGTAGVEVYEKTDEKARELLRRLAQSKPYFRKGREVDQDGNPSGGNPAVGAGVGGAGPIRTRDSRAAAAVGAKAGPRKGPLGAAAPPPGPKDWIPPRDPNIMSLFVTGIEDDLPEYKIRDFFKVFGKIKSLVVSHMTHCAFVNYETRDGAEKAAAERLYNTRQAFLTYEFYLIVRLEESGNLFCVLDRGYYRRVRSWKQGLRTLEPVGPYYLAHARRARHKRTFSEDDRIQAQERAKKVEDNDESDISEPEDPMMLQRDAKDWKTQDHYKVLGLSKYRYKATEDQIKRAHRKKVLKHHPDKKAAAGRVDDDNFFKCIQKATEVLLDPIKRRQFDSVDEEADVEPPTKKQLAKGNYYKLWGHVFKSEARFSKVHPVPSFGDENSTKEEVENFYNFWYNFDSWRTFEYLDEDVPDDNENRDQKRHMERKNANARKKKKAEDNARLRKLLDDCSAGDERIKRFRQEANAAKNRKRLEREAAEKKAAEEARLKKEAEEKAAKEAEEKAKADREAAKKAKEAAKNAVKKNKRVLRGSVKDANYFVEGDPSAATIDAVLGDVELIQGKIDADEIAALAGKLNGLKVADEIKGVWKSEVERLVGAGKLKEGEAKTLGA
ncbi:hypothetical protein C7999DRAFT_41634 [Corynascus novoguineensis]|uniref:Uncharacterized protein n=1 Tax=Corynascus novoguineensis TaxID=1126955 RepID=A0AAN7CRK1_9PEZI|nr:hypothetical protein C7999DRAFT_41634 [Corynascus novoguineensis]